MVAAWWLLGGWLAGWLLGWLGGATEVTLLAGSPVDQTKITSRIASWSLGLIHAFLPLGKPFGRLGLPAVLLHSHLSGLQSWKLKKTLFQGEEEVLNFILGSECIYFPSFYGGKTETIK